MQNCIHAEIVQQACLQGDHQAAIKKYTKALSYLSQLTSPDEDMAKDLSSSSAEVADQLKSVAVPCLLNRAACSLKLQQPREAIMDCHNVLQTDASNTKALFRKGQAHVAVRVSSACNKWPSLGNVWAPNASQHAHDTLRYQAWFGCIQSL